MSRRPRRWRNAPPIAAPVTHTSSTKKACQAARGRDDRGGRARTRGRCGADGTRLIFWAILPCFGGDGLGRWIVFEPQGFLGGARTISPQFFAPEGLLFLFQLFLRTGVAGGLFFVGRAFVSTAGNKQDKKRGGVRGRGAEFEETGDVCPGQKTFAKKGGNPHSSNTCCCFFCFGQRHGRVLILRPRELFRPAPTGACLFWHVGFFGKVFADGERGLFGGKAYLSQKGDAF